MSFITPQIDAFSFLNMVGSLNLPQQLKQTASRKGVDGHAYKLTGLKPVPSQVVTTELISTVETDVDARMALYKALVDEGSVAVRNRHNRIFSRVAVMSVDIQDSFTTNPGPALLMVAWNLEVLP